MESKEELTHEERVSQVQNTIALARGKNAVQFKPLVLKFGSKMIACVPEKGKTSKYKRPFLKKSKSKPKRKLSRRKYRKRPRRSNLSRLLKF